MAIQFEAEVEEVNIELKYEPYSPMKEIALESTEVGKHVKLSIADVGLYRIGDCGQG